MVCAPLVTVSSLLTTLPWPERFDEDVAVAFGEPPYQGESVCLEAVFVIDGPPPPPRNQPSTESCRAGGANHHQPAARPQNSKCLAQDLAALIRTHPAQVPACVVDDDDIEYVAIRGNTSGGSRFDVDENARVGGATTCTFGRRLVGHIGDEAAGEPDALRDRAKEGAVGAAKLGDLLTQLHAGHADDERVGIGAAREESERHEQQLTALSLRLKS